MNRRGDPWDSRPSSESMESPVNRTDHTYNHLRQESVSSVTDVMGQPQLQPQDTLADPRYQKGSYLPPPPEGGDDPMHFTPTHTQPNDFYNGSTSRRDNTSYL
jgi:hypothetical protein